MKTVIAVTLLILFIMFLGWFNCGSTAYAEDKKSSVEVYMERVEPYKDMILRILDEERVPREFIFLCFAESGGKIDSVSEAGAAGLWQLMPYTANTYGLKAADRFDAEKSTRAAAKYIRHLLDVFDGDHRWAIAAYNAGGHNLKRATGYHKGMDFSVVKIKRPAAYALAQTVKGMAKLYPEYPEQ